VKNRLTVGQEISILLIANNTASRVSVFLILIALLACTILLSLAYFYRIIQLASRVSSPPFPGRLFFVQTGGMLQT
jgi:hypothetical protein